MLAIPRSTRTLSASLQGFIAYCTNGRLVERVAQVEDRCFALVDCREGNRPGFKA
jgi:hypothetical protein